MRQLLVLVFIASACSSSDPGGACSTADDCPSGQACVETHCARICSTTNDCTSSTTCQEGVCLPGSHASGIQITGVEGNGADAEHFRDRLVILGEKLDGTDVGLTGTTGSWALDVLEEGSVRLVVALPSDVDTGTYSLTVANGSDSDDATVSLLADPRTADELLALLITVDGTGTTLDADTVDGQHADDFATATELADLRDFTPAAAGGLWEPLDLGSAMLTGGSTLEAVPCVGIQLDGNTSNYVFLQLTPPPSAGATVTLKDIEISFGGTADTGVAAELDVSVRRLSKTEGTFGGPSGSTMPLDSSYVPPSASMDEFMVRNLADDFSITTGALPLTLDASDFYTLDIGWIADIYPAEAHIWGIRANWGVTP